MNSAADDKLAPGTVIADRYVVEAQLPAGDFVVTWRARDRSRDDAQVMIRVLARDIALRTGMGRRFLKHGRRIMRVQDPHVVRLMDWGELSDGRPWFTAEYCDGPTLAELLELRGRLSVREAARFGRHVLLALEAAHAAGVVHRDLKSSSVYVVRDEATGEHAARVVDFGIAEACTAEDEVVVPRSMVDAGGVACTPQYAAPELIAGEGGPEADLYAVGCLMHEMLDGRVPYGHLDDLEAIVRAQRGTDPVPLGEETATSPLAEVVMRALAKDPALRFESAAEMREAIDWVLERLPRPVTASQLAVSSSQRAVTGSQRQVSASQRATTGAERAVSGSNATVTGSQRTVSGTPRTLPAVAPGRAVTDTGSRRDIGSLLTEITTANLAAVPELEKLVDSVRDTSAEPRVTSALPVASVSRPLPAVPEKKEPRPWHLYAALAVALLIVGVAGALVLTGPETVRASPVTRPEPAAANVVQAQPATAGAQQAAPEAVDPTAAIRLAAAAVLLASQPDAGAVVRVDVAPGSASVTLGGVPVTGPFPRTAWAGTERPLTFRATAQGFVAAEVTLEASTDTTVELTLAREPRPEPPATSSRSSSRSEERAGGSRRSEDRPTEETPRSGGDSGSTGTGSSGASNNPFGNITVH